MERAIALDEQVRAIAEAIRDARDVLFIGRHTGYPAALEGALKLKELSYIHAEGYPAGELKHGPIALVEDGVPVVAVATQCHVYRKMLSNIQEVRARGAEVIAVATEGDAEIGALADHVLEVPRTPELLSPVVVTRAAAAARLPRGHAARLRRRPAAEPREERHGRVAEREVEPRPAAKPSGVEIVGLGVDICEIARMERALARHPTMRERVFTPEEHRLLRRQGPSRRVLRGPVRGPGGHDQGARRLPGPALAGHLASTPPSGAPSIELRATRSRADALGITRC